MTLRKPNMGTFLLRNPRGLSQRTKRARSELVDHARLVLINDKTLTGEELREALELYWLLKPLSLGALVEVGAVVRPEMLKDDDRNIVFPHVAKAKVTFEGSPALWRMRPGSLVFPFRGTVAGASASWRELVDDMNLIKFEAKARRVFIETRDALDEFASKVELYNDNMRHLIDRVLRAI